jgi:hypothetical protein
LIRVEHEESNAQTFSFKSKPTAGPFKAGPSNCTTTFAGDDSTVALLLPVLLANTCFFISEKNAISTSENLGKYHNHR